jgi:hypothetical protein
MRCLSCKSRAHNAYEAAEHLGSLYVREEVASYNSFQNELDPRTLPPS